MERIYQKLTKLENFATELVEKVFDLSRNLWVEVDLLHLDPALLPRQGHLHGVAYCKPLSVSGMRIQGRHVCFVVISNILIVCELVVFTVRKLL